MSNLNKEMAARTNGQITIEVKIYDREGHPGGVIRVKEKCMRECIQAFASIITVRSRKKTLRVSSDSPEGDHKMAPNQKITPKKLEQMNMMFAKGISSKDIARKFKVSDRTVRKYKKAFYLSIG